MGGEAVIIRIWVAFNGEEHVGGTGDIVEERQGCAVFLDRLSLGISESGEHRGGSIPKNRPRRLRERPGAAIPRDCGMGEEGCVTLARVRFRDDGRRSNY